MFNRGFTNTSASDVLNISQLLFLEFLCYKNHSLAFFSSQLLLLLEVQVGYTAYDGSEKMSTLNKEIAMTAVWLKLQSFVNLM